MSVSIFDELNDFLSVKQILLKSDIDIESTFLFKAHRIWEYSFNLFISEFIERSDAFTPLNSFVERGFYKGNVYRFRKGACENCGAITHKTKECFERPRKRGAKYTKNNFRSDEYIKPLPFKNDYEGKRDRWNGYETAKELEKFREYENIRKQIELKEKEDNKERLKIEELKEEDKQKELKIQQLQKLILTLKNFSINFP